MPRPKGPYNIRIDYLTTVNSIAFPHTLEVNVTALGAPAIGTPAASVNLGTRSGGSISFATAANDLWNVFRLAMGTATTSATTATLTRYDGPPDGDVFISAVALTNTGGAFGQPAQAGHETILTLRTGLGNVMKINYLEDGNAERVRAPLVASAVGTAYQRMAAYLLSGTTPVHGRGGAFAIALMNESKSFNEAIEKARFRPNT